MKRSPLAILQVHQASKDNSELSVTRHRPLMIQGSVCCLWSVCILSDSGHRNASLGSDNTIIGSERCILVRSAEPHSLLPPVLDRPSFEHLVLRPFIGAYTRLYHLLVHAIQFRVGFTVDGVLPTSTCCRLARHEVGCVDHFLVSAIAATQPSTGTSLDLLKGGQFTESTSCKIVRSHSITFYLIP